MTGLACVFAGLVRIRVTATAPGKPVFVAVAPASAARSYLSGVAYTSVTSLGNRATTIAHTGAVRPRPPATAAIWAAQAAGAGTRALVWTVRDGDWMAIAMNPDGSAGVSVRADVGAQFPALAALALELLVTGVLLAVPAMALIVVPANNRPPARHCSLLRVRELVDARQGNQPRSSDVRAVVGRTETGRSAAARNGTYLIGVDAGCQQWSKGSPMRYMLNGFLLVIPLLLFDAAFASRLPAAYQAAQWNDVPALVALPEGVLRVGTMLLTLLLPISAAGPAQRFGAVLYAAGLVAYVTAWTMQIRWPGSAWSTGTAGFLAPAVTPALWLTGIGLIGMRPLLPHARYLPWVFLGTAAAFLAFHTLHAVLVFRRM
jgi:hypothetical protein